uniref:50S ribosomal protein L10 n=1 Tax=Arundo donax TaxID=35708 RepID=A0A0A9D5U0_ARUDO
MAARMVERRGRAWGRSEAAVDRVQNAGRDFAVGSVVGRKEVSIARGGRRRNGGLGWARGETDGGREEERVEWGSLSVRRGFSWTWSTWIFGLCGTGSTVSRVLNSSPSATAVSM